MKFENAHAAYGNAVSVFYLWIGSFVVPIVLPFELPITNSVKGINIMLVPVLFAGAYYAPRIIKSGIKSDIAVFIVVPVCLILLGAAFRALSI